MMTRVYIIHLIRRAAACCVWLIRGLVPAGPGLELVGFGIVCPETGIASAHGSEGPTPQKRGSEAISPSPLDAKLNKTTGRGVLGVMFRLAKELRGCIYFRFQKGMLRIPGVSLFETDMVTR